MMDPITIFLGEDHAAVTFYAELAPSYRRRYREWVAAARDDADQAVRLRHVQGELRAHHRVLKVGSYMGDVGLTQGIALDPALQQTLVALSEQATHPQMAMFAIKLTKHVAAVLGRLDEPATAQVIQINQAWLAGTAPFQAARALAGVMMARCRAASTPAAKDYYRFCHQATLTPHVKRHALIAAAFAVRAVAGSRAPQALAEQRCQLALLRAVLAQ